jgi:hypothetical protein
MGSHLLRSMPSSHFDLHLIIFLTDRCPDLEPAGLHGCHDPFAGILNEEVPES